MPLAARKHGNEKVRGSLDFGRGGEGGEATLREKLKPLTILPEVELALPGYCKNVSEYNFARQLVGG